MNGVVTITDEKFYRGTLLLITSLYRLNFTDICVFNFGLSDDKREVLGGLCQVIDEQGSSIPHVKDWRYWYKPFCIMKSPFQKTLWLDSDIVVLCGIDEMFQRIEDRFQVFSDIHAPTMAKNGGGLYKHCPPKHKPDNTVLNAGVIGLDLLRDKNILDMWTSFILKAVEDKKITEYVRWWDQGALLWTYWNSRAFEISREAKTWNRPANRRKKYDYTDEIYDEIQCHNAGANIVHWMGQPKLTDLLR